MRIYAESSAVLAWLLGEPEGEEVRAELAGAEEVFTSILTIVETDRVLIRTQVLEGLKVTERRRVMVGVSKSQLCDDWRREEGVQ